MRDPNTHEMSLGRRYGVASAALVCRCLLALWIAVDGIELTERLTVRSQRK